MAPSREEDVVVEEDVVGVGSDNSDNEAEGEEAEGEEVEEEATAGVLPLE